MAARPEGQELQLDLLRSKQSGRDGAHDLSNHSQTAYELAMLWNLLEHHRLQILKYKGRVLNKTALDTAVKQTPTETNLASKVPNGQCLRSATKVDNSCLHFKDLAHHHSSWHLKGLQMNIVILRCLYVGARESMSEGGQACQSVPCATLGMFGCDLYPQAETAKPRRSCR
jgi:hypothetical protein